MRVLFLIAAIVLAAASAVSAYVTWVATSFALAFPLKALGRPASDFDLLAAQVGEWRYVFTYGALTLSFAAAAWLGARRALATSKG